MPRFSMALACLVAASFLAHAALAFENCTDQQVISRVCTGPAQDDTGIAKTFSEMTNLREELGSAGTHVSETSYERFVRVFERVKDAYWKLAARMSPDDRMWHEFRLSGMKPPTRQRLSESKISAVVLGANGSYSPMADDIDLTPIILNNSDLSEVELAALIAHEMGHSLDPEAFDEAQFPFRKNVRHTTLSPELNRCFEDSFTPRFLRPHPTWEDYADWMASQVMREVVDSAPTPESRQARALDVAYVFCGGKGVTSKAFNAFDETFAFTDPHLPGPDRILTFMKDPGILQAIGCGPKVLSRKTGRALPRCDFWD